MPTNLIDLYNLLNDLLNDNLNDAELCKLLKHDIATCNKLLLNEIVSVKDYASLMSNINE